MLAIMGASGAGKSTLLDILATRVERTKVEGTYTVDNSPVGPDFKRMSGYVMQVFVQDSLMKHKRRNGMKEESRQPNIFEGGACACPCW
ncbi:unnamed protein product [Discosporangium mesarthrocarpum]